MKHFTPDGLTIVNSPPNNIKLFIMAPCIQELCYDTYAYGLNFFTFCYLQMDTYDRLAVGDLEPIYYTLSWILFGSYLNDSCCTI